MIKNYTGYLIVGGAIIVASIIMSITILTNKTSSLDHCYKKVYVGHLAHLKKYNKSGTHIDQLTSKVTVIEKKSISQLESRAALYGKRKCHRKY